MTNSIQMLDWRGTPIVTGSTVVYPGRKGSHQWMVEARVIEIYQQDHWGTLVWTLRVQPLRKGAYGRTDMKPVKVTALERVTVIPTCPEIEGLTDLSNETIVASLIH